MKKPLLTDRLLPNLYPEAMMPKPTDRAIRMSHEWLDSIKVTQREDWRDLGAVGLVVRISPTGSRVFYWFGRITGNLSRLKLGVYPNMPLAEARREAKRITGEAAIGKTPTARVTAAKGELSLGDLFEWYMRVHSRPHKKSWRKDERTFDLKLAHWRTRKVSTISMEMVEELSVAIGEADGPEAANKTLELLGTMFKKAKRPLKLTFENPVDGVKRFAKPERERFLDGDELPKFLDAVGNLKPVMRDVFLIALFTGARRSNVCSMEWEHIDLKNGLWHIPKTDYKTKRSTAVVLTELVVEILKQRQNKSQFVFPSYGVTGHIVEPKHSMRIVLKAAGLKDVRFHDLRRTLGSWQAAQNVSLQIIGKSLGHSSMKSTKIYSRLQMDPVRDAVERATLAMRQPQNNSEDSLK